MSMSSVCVCVCLSCMSLEMSSLQCMSVISCIVHLGNNKPAIEGSKYFELGWQPHKFLNSKFITFHQFPTTRTFHHDIQWVQSGNTRHSRLHISSKFALHRVTCLLTVIAYSDIPTEMISNLASTQITSLRPNIGANTQQC